MPRAHRRTQPLPELQDPRLGDLVAVHSYAGLFRVAQLQGPWPGVILVSRDGNVWGELFTVAISELRPALVRNGVRAIRN